MSTRQTERESQLGYLVWDGDAKAPVLRATICPKELLQVVNQEWKVYTVQASCLHCCIVQLWAATVRDWVANDTIHLLSNTA